MEWKILQNTRNLLKYNIHYAGLNFFPEQIVEITNILNNLNLILNQRKIIYLSIKISIL